MPRSLFPEIDGDIKFVVDHEPIAQPRQRHAYVQKLGRVINYIEKDHPVHTFKRICQARAKEAYQGKPLQGPLAVFIIAVFPRPETKFWRNKPMPRYRHTSKPDADNVAKACLDCLNQILWHDDAQIFSLKIEKYVASGDESAHVEICVEEHYAVA